ncbi:FAD binding domain-containing protein [Priestia abyssalis]|uniref:FAD binding domain-containing protein n=1 Tax=Priestia abyssalis TaxID=1221450 RepID=UPI000995C438|nr:FAD binding domain-containing protein [Priestia abyssalis]
MITAGELQAQVWMPSSVEEAWEAKQKLGSDACFVSGGTLLQTQWEKGVPCPGNFISLERIQEMRGVSKEFDGNRTVLQVGALTSLSLCQGHPFIIKKDWALLGESIRSIAAPAVRNRGTLGGNISSRFGDSIPALLAMDAEIISFDGKKRRRQELWKWLKSKAEPPLLISILLPEEKRAAKTVRFYKKIGRREAFSVSLIAVSGLCIWNEKGEVEKIRLAAGGGDNPPQRLTDCEKLLEGSIPDPDLWQKLYLEIAEEFQPVSDAFASADYRKWTAANVIMSELTRLKG